MQGTNVWIPKCERGGGINWEIGIDIYTLPGIKQITNKNLLQSTWNSPWCSEMTSIGRKSRPHGLQPTRLRCPWDSPGKNPGVGGHSLFQGIFPTQGSNQGLLHCRQILYHLSPPGKPTQGRGYTCKHIANSLCCTAETDSSVKQLQSNKKIKKEKHKNPWILSIQV